MMFDFHVTKDQAQILLEAMSLYLKEYDVFTNVEVSKATQEHYRNGLNLRNRLKNDLLKMRRVQRLLRR